MRALKVSYLSCKTNMKELMSISSVKSYPTKKELSATVPFKSICMNEGFCEKQIMLL